ncbi:hypothetical protein Agub_g8289 [Astrephomene gubernaculifera]|uniref:Uncharacterized protein n=1 Tax=Astrephomene gubernaculifera TaxID=47775 RepID=A0AAD3DT57_9CHLO|nr:hypothetical protein Agub_g8289 [Astrephomene gubernaculifera]
MNDTSPSFSPPMEMDDHLVKVIFVGSEGVGKTCLVRRLFSDKFDSETQPTIACDFYFKRYKFDNKSVGVTLWDTAGAEKFQAITSNYYRGAQGVVFVYDVTRRDTLDAISSHWLPEVERHGTHADAVKVVLGNKIDRVRGSEPPRGSDAALLTPDICSYALQARKLQDRAVSPEEGVAFARAHGCAYHETSAATDEGVYDALVWGLLVSIVDTPSLLRSYQPQESLAIDRVQGGGGGGGGAGGGCCG